MVGVRSEGIVWRPRAMCGLLPIDEKRRSSRRKIGPRRRISIGNLRAFRCARRLHREYCREGIGTDAREVLDGLARQRRALLEIALEPFRPRVVGREQA